MKKKKKTRNLKKKRRKIKINKTKKNFKKKVLKVKKNKLKKKTRRKVNRIASKRRLKKTKLPNFKKQIKQFKKISFIKVAKFTFKVFDKAIMETADFIAKPLKSFRDYKQKNRIEKLKRIEKETKEKEKQIKNQERLRIQLKEKELKEEIKIAKERNKDIKIFLRKEQAEIRKEQAERRKRFLTELKLEKQIENFKKREEKELRHLSKLALKEQREDYAGLQIRIEKLKEKYKAIRDQKIRERVEALGVNIQEGDDRETLLEKEKQYTLERQKIQNCLESFYRSSNSLCFQLNKRYIPRHLSILRCIDKRFETSEIFIKFDESDDEDWLLLIYIKDDSPDGNVIIENKSNPEKNEVHEFKQAEIFKASDMMVDALTNLLEREQKKVQNKHPLH